MSDETITEEMLVDLERLLNEDKPIPEKWIIRRLISSLRASRTRLAEAVEARDSAQQWAKIWKSCATNWRLTASGDNWKYIADKYQQMHDAIKILLEAMTPALEHQTNRVQEAEAQAAAMRNVLKQFTRVAPPCCPHGSCSICDAAKSALQSTAGQRMLARLQAAEHVVEASRNYDRVIEAGFASRERPDIARGKVIHALDEYDAIVAGKDGK